MPGASRLAEFGTTTSGGPVSHRCRPPLGEDDDRVRNGEQMAQAQLAQGGRGVRAGLGVQVDADQVVRGQPAGDAVAGGPGRGGEHLADARRVRRGVVHPVAEPAALAVAGGAGVVVVGRAQGRELGPGQGEDGQAAFGGGQGMGEGQRRGLPVGGGHALHVRTYVRKRKRFIGR